MPAKAVTVQDIERRSRFVTDLERASSVPDARAFVEQIRLREPEATHHCWAFLVGPPGTTAHVGFSDDGEPHGTAGQPMFTALLHSGIGDVVAVCTRYYGGVKLGTGGLARAYAGGVTHALEALHTEQKISRVAAVLDAEYSDAAGLKRLAEAWSVTIDGEEYGERVTLRCGVPEARWESFIEAVADASSGRARLTPAST